jgi:hypothetical protein
MLAINRQESATTAGRGVLAMKRIVLLITSAVFAGIIVAAVLFSPGAAKEARKPHKPVPSPTPYNPYPPGILPPDLDSEILRVRSEVRGIESEALAQWGALTPPTLTGQPPTLQGTGMRANQLLGKLMNFDEHMSPFQNRACGFCHMPYAVRRL